MSPADARQQRNGIRKLLAQNINPAHQRAAERYREKKTTGSGVPYPAVPVRHAVHQELIENNPAANLDGIIAPPVKRHYPVLPLRQLPELLTSIEDYK